MQRESVTNREHPQMQTCLVRVFRVLQTHEAASSVINRDPCQNTLHNGPTRGATGFRSPVETSPGLSIFGHTQQSQQVITRDCVFVLGFRLFLMRMKCG